MDINKTDPDYELEHFWYTYKCSLDIFYNNYKCYKRPLSYWNDELNFYKKKGDYDVIQKKIFDYLTLHMVDIIKSMNSYHSRILETNFNRYIKICEKIKFYNFSDEIIRLKIIFKIYCSILLKEKITDIESQIFNQIELVIFYDDFDLLIKYAINNNKGIIIDYLIKIIDITKYIFKIYGITINHNMKGKKILELFNN